MKISTSLSNRISGLTVLLTLLIVWLHICPYYDVPESFTRIAIIAVPCFFTISSFFYFLSFDFNNLRSCYINKIFTRTKTLLLPFLLFNIIGIIELK